MERNSKPLGRLLRAALTAPLVSLGVVGCHHGPVPLVDVPPEPALHCPPMPAPQPSHAKLNGAKDPTPSQPAEPSEPIDLPTALRLVNARNPEVVLARERIREALAKQDQAEVLWLPNVELGATWMRHDGQIQRAVGDVFPTSRSSLFVGGGPALNVNVADAIFAPLAARQFSEARRAGATGVANEQSLEVALAYIDLLQAHADLRINEETYQNALQLLKLTEDYERAGKGAAADTARARTEANRRIRQRTEIRARIGIVSARLVQLLQLPPQVMLQPVDPAVVPIALVAEELPLEELLSLAVANRPELAENRAVVNATVESWRAAKVAPWIPNLRLSYAAGGFGGGINDFFGDFDGRSDVALTAVWQLQNFGLGDMAKIRERQSQHAQATFRQASVEAKVASQVVSSFRVAFAKRQELVAAQREVASARDSYRLNEERIRRAPEQGRPIELLQAVQALAQARQDYLSVVADYNRAQFRLYSSLGNPPLCAADNGATIETTEPTIPTAALPEKGPRPKLLQPN